MDKKELMMIQELMQELADKMEYGEDDFNERLGRKKPEIEVMKVEGEMPMDEMDQDESPEMDEDVEDMDMMSDGLQMDMSPEDKLKQRIQKLRGE